MPLAIGTQLGPYEILAPLGAGGMAEVYRARDLRLGRDVALKVLPAEVAANAEWLARFEREARTVAGLNHPNIVMLHSVEDHGEVRFLTMELIEGQNLAAALVPGGLPVPRVIELGIALADALSAAHQKGVIHRDLKPENVMLTRDGRVKVLDFGLAKLKAVDSNPSQSSASTLTTPISEVGRIEGTVPYMAPEQVRGEAVDARTDLFALGIVLYELATGKRPFLGETPVDISHAILHQAAKPLARMRPDLPADLDRIVNRCLEKNPRGRFQTAGEVSNELRLLLRELERGGAVAPSRRAAEKVASIAVLPFVNRSASADDEYFSDGLADELLNMLSRIKGLRVVARASAFQFKGKNEDLTVIGARLNVATVLDGSVRKSGNRIRVSVQLVSVSDSTHLWSETYDRTLEDIFAVQDDIAHSVVQELRKALLGEMADSRTSGAAKAEVAQAAKGRATDPEAHRLYLLARHLIDRLTREDTARAILHLKEALARDPEYALAWEELGWAYAKEADRGWAPVAEGYRRARDAVERALALEPDLAEAHARMGWIRMLYDWDFRGAEASYARALELSPGNAAVLRIAGVLALIQGRLEDAIGLYRRALEQDPLSAAAYSNLGLALYAADRFAESEAALRAALELAPQRSVSRAYLSLNLLAQGHGEEALSEALKVPEEAFRLWTLALVDHYLGRRAESDAALKELIAKDSEGGFLQQVAQVYAARGEVDTAFDWLERAYAHRDPGLAEMKTTPHLRSLHGDSRWAALLEKMGLERDPGWRAGGLPS